VSFFEKHGRAKDLILYSCTSGYPVPFEDISLLEISRLKETFGGRVRAVGFSGHHLGIAADVAAMTLGAEWIERHFTLDRTWKGTDHAASLEPDGLRRLCRDIKNVYKALQYKSEEVLPIEQVQRDKLKWKKSD
jgi:N-acetylneuraminate synthase